MAYLPLILLLGLLAMTVYFLRATSAAVDKGKPVGGMGGGAVMDQAKEDKKKADERKANED
ncbi:hypothetical protein [Jannaschia formosa]|uniref:hypothetical protein n=1 Tax=Jannaschia formosa TaxID=2259592 RepID=UPI000E1BADEC|nr:hypothetical protein [Jannaschia formosa]TFL17688.1 hypothetical protein DR046_13595 [Jannaschia formosa]